MFSLSTATGFNDIYTSSTTAASHNSMVLSSIVVINIQRPALWVYESLAVVLTCMLASPYGNNPSHPHATRPSCPIKLTTRKFLRRSIVLASNRRSNRPFDVRLEVPWPCIGNTAAQDSDIIPEAACFNMAVIMWHARNSFEDVPRFESSPESHMYTVIICENRDGFL